MARAAELLRNGNLPIKTIAFGCGYSLVSNFHRDFKRVNGISPKQMRLERLKIHPPHEISILAGWPPAGRSETTEAAAGEGTQPSRSLFSGKRARAANE
jgi:AraC-like DNA-binding protein